MRPSASRLVATRVDRSAPTANLPPVCAPSAAGEATSRPRSISAGCDRIGADVSKVDATSAADPVELRRAAVQDLTLEPRATNAREREVRHTAPYSRGGCLRS